MKFTVLTFLYAALLIADALIAHSFSEIRDIELLTPLFWGGLILLIGILTIKKELHDFARHAAIVLSLVAFITTIGNVLDFFSVENTLSISVYSKSVMALLSIAFMIAAVFSLRAERLKEEINNE